MIRLTHTLAALGFVLLASGTAAAQPGDFPQLQMDQPAEGTLDASAPRDIDGRPFRVFWFQAEPGRRYTANMRSSSFDSYLTLARMNAGITENLRQDDDGGEGTDARLRFTVPSSGAYLLIARGYSSAADGSFTVGVEDGGEITVPAAVTVRVGATVEGSLSDDDGFLPEIPCSERGRCGYAEPGGFHSTRRSI